MSTKRWREVRQDRPPDEVEVGREKLELSFLRQQLGASQAQLAEALGTSQSNVSQLERRPAAPTPQKNRLLYRGPVSGASASCPGSFARARTSPVCPAALLQSRATSPTTRTRLSFYVGGG